MRLEGTTTYARRGRRVTLPNIESSAPLPLPEARKLASEGTRRENVTYVRVELSTGEVHLWTPKRGWH